MASVHLIWTLLYFIISMISVSAADKPQNVLFIVVDDMRPELGCYRGPDFPSHIHPNMHTPNIDTLASRSLLLKRAYVQQAVCSPSRTSLLTGRRPDTTHVHDFLHYWRTAAGNFTTIPQYFKEHGYHTVGMGKVFHPGRSSGGDDPISWSEKYFHADNSHWIGRKLLHAWMAADDKEVAEHPLEDMQLATHAMETLKRLGPKGKTGEQPFFVAVGFHRPHLPFVVPQSFFKYYPKEEIRMPSNPFSPWRMPEIAWSNNAELRQYNDMNDHHWYGGINETLSDNVVLNLRRAYYAAITYTDSLIGQVLERLDELGLSNDTIVSLWADHGWQLGEHAEWSKCTNFELATHAPMMVHVPGVTDKGIVTEALTEFVDLFPSLVELAGLPKIPMCPEDSSEVLVCTEGFSFVPLIQNATRPWKKAAFSQYPRMYISGDVKMGYSMRTDQYRYTEWPTYDAPTYTPIPGNAGGSVELYDHKVDPDENVNRKGFKKYRAAQGALHKALWKGWRDALPPGF